MAIDITGIILIILFFWRGYSKGLIVAALSVIAILLGILCALKFSQLFSAWLLLKGFTTSAWAPVLSYVILFAIVVFIVRFIANLLQNIAEKMLLGTINRIAGGTLYVILALIVWSSLLWLGDKVHVVSPEVMALSKTYTYVAPIAPWFFDTAGKVLPFVKDTFSNLEHFFDSVSNKIPTHVDTH